MSEFIKKRVIKDLIEELADIDPTSLEIIGHKVIETLESKQLVHHGINKNYNPVGYTVDTFSQDFTVVGQYSAQDEYFKDSSGRKKLRRFDKIEDDIQHALSKGGHTVPSKIYLVSCEEEPASFRGEFNVSSLGKEHSARVSFLDARELAKNIFEFSQRIPLAADFYRYYLPDFAQNLDNYEYYGRVPPACPNHLSEPLFLRAIGGHFATGARVCVLYGLSGSGKTQAAIDYVHTALGEYGNYLWIAGEDWKEDLPLTAIKRSRGGVAINVAGLFNSIRTILVIDDLSRPVFMELFDELGTGFALGGRVIVTSQLGQPNSPIHLQVPRLSTATAYRILGEDEATASTICRRFVEACRFSPSILSVTQKMAEIDDICKEDLYREILEMPGNAHEDDGRPIMARILQRLSDANRQALVKIANSGCTTYDSRFFTKFIGANARASLQRLALINRTESSSTLTVHDLVCSAVRERDDTSDLADAVEFYVASHSGEMVPSVLRQIHLSAVQLLAADERRGERRPDWLTYAILQMERSGRQERYAHLHQIPLCDDMPIAELLCIVDSKEAHSYRIPQEDRRAYYEACANEYGELAKEIKDPAVRAEMLHHQGKALRRCGQLEAAMSCFQQLLSEKPEWHATYGQIAHVGNQRGADSHMRVEGEKAISTLLEEVLNDSISVPLRVSLAALSRLRSYPSLGEEFGKDAGKVRKLAEVVGLSALDGFDQFYEAFLALTSVFLYHHPGICLDLAEAFPDMLAIVPSAVDQRQWQNACEGLTNIAKAAQHANKPELTEKLRGAAIAFAKELSQLSGDNLFVARLLAKTFLDAGDKNEALAAVHRIPDEERDHWLLYQQSKVELAMDRSDDAHATAERALALALTDPKAERRLASYHEQVALSLQAVGRLPESIQATETAIGLAQGQYKATLQARLEELLR
jgi:tetratricopeptide (TPR) repeat protein